MKANEIHWILKEVTESYGIEFSLDKFKGKDMYGFHHVDEDNYILTVFNYLGEISRTHNLSVLRHELNASELEGSLIDLTAPMLAFNLTGKEPVLITNRPKEGLVLHYNEHNKEALTLQELLKKIYSHNGKYMVFNFLPVTSLFSETEKEDYNGNLKSLKDKPIKRFFRLMNLERKDIGYIYIYALMAGLVYLSLPLGIQAIIGLVMSGQVSTSVVVLVSFVLLGILINGGLQIMQISMIEYLQRRLFTKAAFEFSFRIPKVKLESILKEYAPELMNRFFDILTVQKGLSKLLLDFSTATLQVFFGVFLLAFYHPFFIFFGLFLLAVLAFIIWLTGPKGLETSLKTSKYKYKVAHWLEELARSVTTFKLAGFTNLPMEKTDQVMNNYLTARKAHFKVLLFQYSNIVGFKILVTGGLLILGSMLVIGREINIGQFVAAEIIIILIINAVEKMIMSLDVIYDVLTAVEKIGTVTDLPLEDSKGLYVHQFSDSHTGFNIKAKNLNYSFPDVKASVLKNINFEIQQSERICLSGYNGAGKSTLVYVLCGLYQSYKGEISFDSVSMRDINITSLRWLIGDNLSQEDIFEGSLLENITLGRENISFEDVLWATESAGLGNFIRNLNDGFSHNLIASGKGLPGSIIRKIVIARAIVHKPKLLILDDNNMAIQRPEKKKILDLIYGKNFKWTVINVSNDPFVMKQSDRIIVMQDGAIMEIGDYETISTRPYFKELILS
jgi:ABC-type bacteriocin/lantibiotic exporter with double-glycine peptidase domain